uniref:Uncharacterized protein n=1 Tax=Panagrolaimus sp. JU765 TaxID=591449 RepID=A0AC34QUA5_9BILA
MSDEEQAALNWFETNHYKNLEKLAAEELSSTKYPATVAELCTKKLEELLDKNPSANITAEELAESMASDARKLVPNEVKQRLINETLKHLNDYFEKLGPRK